MIAHCSSITEVPSVSHPVTPGFTAEAAPAAPTGDDGLGPVKEPIKPNTESLLLRESILDVY